MTAIPNEQYALLAAKLSEHFICHQPHLQKMGMTFGWVTNPFLRMP
jgi:hypothetical protein